MNVLLVFQFVFAIDKDIVEVGGTEVVEVSSKGFVNIALKGGRAITESKGQYKVFEEPMSGTEGCKVFLAFFYTDSIERGDNIELYIDLGLQ